MPGRQGSSCASLCGGPAGGIIARPSAVRPAGVYARTQPDGMARQAGESLCASSVVRKAAEPAKNRPPAARPECMPGGNRRPQPLPWQTVGAYPVALRFGRRGSRCAPRQWSGRRRPQNSSARGPEEGSNSASARGPAGVHARRQPPAPTPSVADRRGLPGGAAVRQAGE